MISRHLRVRVPVCKLVGPLRVWIRQYVRSSIVHIARIELEIVEVVSSSAPIIVLSISTVIIIGSRWLMRRGQQAVPLLRSGSNEYSGGGGVFRVRFNGLLSLFQSSLFHL